MTATYCDFIDGESVINAVRKPVPDHTKITGVLVGGINIDYEHAGRAVLINVDCVPILQTIQQFIYFR